MSNTMREVIRNGQYLITDEVLLSDTLVYKKPHADATWLNGKWILNIDELLSKENSNEALAFLNSTDWKVIRHLDQLALGIETSLCEEEYLQLLQQRQESREAVVNE